MEEYILPDQNASLLPCATDMAVMVFCSGLDRTRQHWMRQGDGLGIIEAELA